MGPYFRRAKYLLGLELDKSQPWRAGPICLAVGLLVAVGPGPCPIQQFWPR